MINLRKLLAPAFILFTFSLAAQTGQHPGMDNYKPARSNGPLPKDFLTSTVEKYEKDKQQIDAGQDESMQKAQDAFYLQTNYSVDQLRFSGAVLVNDTMGQYVNRIVDTLLASDKELRSKLTFYILRSAYVNAFTTNQGAIFVTVGLLTRLHNEAELAFVLGHEIIHYKRNHVITGYVEGVKAREGVGQYEATTFENRFLKRHRYARSQESQADEEGFDLLVASNYDPRAAIAAFDILALADAPFSDTLFTKDFFETNYLVFPSKFYVDTIRPIKPQDEDEDDDLATHPSVYKRKKAMLRRFNKLSDTTGSKFLVSEKMFWRVKEMARFEEIALHTGDADFGESMYSNYSEQKFYPNNRYLEKEMVRAMYAMAIRKDRLYSYEDFAALLEALFSGSFAEDDKPIGEQGRFLAFVRKTDAKGWNVAALSYAWTIHKLYPDDKDITLWCTGLFRELTVRNGLRMDDFETTDSVFISIGDKAAADTSIARKIKINTPAGRFQAAIDHLDRDSLDNFRYWQFAFIEHLKDSEFVQMFRASVAYADSVEISDSLWYDKSKHERRLVRREYSDSIHGPQGMTSIVAVNPVFVAYDYRNENSDVNVRQSIDGREELVAEMASSAARVGMKIQFLDATGMDTGTVERFNDLMIVSEWFDQRSEFGDNQILPYPQEQMKAIAEKYGTKYFMWSAYVTQTDKRRGKFFQALSIAFAPLAPQLAYRLATPRQDIYFIAIVYDITTGKPVFVQRTNIKDQRATKDRMRLHVYDLMRTLAKPKKN
jgi:beta-barrel assembly-enhancing protease